MEKMESTGMIKAIPVRQDGRKLWQYLASISACLLAVSVGTALAWTSPVLPQLYQANSWLVITRVEGSWISSLLAPGAMLGALLSGPMADRLGRKKSLLLLAIPFLLSWTIIVFAYELWLINTARLIVGIGVGASCVLVPTYICEIAETTTRGTLASLFALFLTLGIVLAFVLGAVMSYTMFAIVCGLIEVIFLITFLCMPESPVWLMNENRKPEATLALEVLRGKFYDPSDELVEMQRTAAEAALTKLSIFDLIRTPATRRSIFATSGIMCFQQLSGINAVIFYTVVIFQESGSSMSPDIASIIVAMVQLVMSAVAALIVDRAGRKPLLMFSSAVMSASLMALGLYFKLQMNGSDVSKLSWLPLTSLTFFMIAFSVGLGPVPWLLMGELFSAETKAVASGFAVMLNWFLVFLVTKTFPGMNKELGTDVTFWMFAVFMAVATVFTFLIVPETKGKSFQEIQQELQGDIRFEKTKA